MPKTQAEIKIVGSSTFGRYPKISLEKTYNMFISDDWLVSYPGFKKVLEINANSEGRGLFHSIRGNFLIYVVGSSVYKITTGIGSIKVGNLSSSTGEVFMDENLSSQICIVDGIDAYIYNWSNKSLTKQNFAYAPGFVSYHNSFFLIAQEPTQPHPENWFVYQFLNDTEIVQLASNAGGTFSIQTKPDVCLAVHRIPGRGNNIIAIGSAVSEVYTQVGGSENYRRNSSFNINSGCVSKSTIACADTLVCWLGQNENNSPTIMFTDGSNIEQISTDGINYQLQEIQFPEQSTAFFYKQDGHLFYQLTFYNSADNLSLVYDFNTSKFFHVTDWRLNYHPARQVVFFEEKTYFASLSEGSIYQMDTNIIDQINVVGDVEGHNIPRIRICNTVRQGSTKPFRVNEVVFVMEQGVNSFPQMRIDSSNCTDIMITEDGNVMISEGGAEMQGEDGICATNINRPCVDMSISKNGAQTFSGGVRRYLNAEGHYRNMISWHRLGFANEFTVQLEFSGMQRFVINDGLADITT